MVGRQDEKQAVGPVFLLHSLFQHAEGRQRNGRSRTPRGRLKDDCAPASGFVQGRRRVEAAVFTAHHDGRAGLFQMSDAAQGLAEQRSAAVEEHELLGMPCARGRPKARPAPAAQDDWLYLHDDPLCVPFSGLLGNLAPSSRKRL